MMPNQCPQCGRFVKNVVATKNGFEEIINVKADCSKCGVVHPIDWYYEQFDPNLPKDWF